MHNRDKVLIPFLSDKSTMVEEVIQLLREKGGFPHLRQQGPRDEIDGNPPCLVMATNEGHLDMLWNFLCGLKQNRIAIPRHIIFVSSPTLVTKLEALGLVVGGDLI